jgi:hypothetical protein
MAIYRSDQAVVTFASEAALGGYRESGVSNGTASGSGTLAAAANAGDRSFSSGTAFTAGQYVAIGTVGSGATQQEVEVRRVISKLEAGTNDTYYIDAPLAAYHASGQTVKVVTEATDTDNDKQITYIPGVYDTVTVPDFTPTIEPRYYLGTAAKRNFTAAYKGTQTYSGSVSSFILLNGWPLRFPLGRINTVMSGTTDTASALDGAHKKGDYFLLLASGTSSNISQHDYVQIGTGITAEVVRVISSVSAHKIRISDPLKFDHATSAAVTPMNGSTGAVNYFTHTIHEENVLDSISMNVHMRDSGETAANDFDRRFYGGKVGAATLSAEEGGLLVMGWDTIPFMGGVHNQKLDSNFSGSEALPFFSHFQKVESDNIGSRTGTSSALEYPTQDPYYFSQGTVSLFGQTFARIRNFSLSINNNVEPRYYIERRGDSRQRGPNDLVEMRREYTMSATVTLPDSEASLTGSTASLFKELLLEGDYGLADGTNSGMKGFAIQLTFNKGAIMTGVNGAAIADVDHKITIDIPTDGVVGGMDVAAATGLNNAGAFLTEAPHPIDGSSPFEVSAGFMFRNMGITIVDNQPLYP